MLWVRFAGFVDGADLKLVLKKQMAATRWLNFFGTLTGTVCNVSHKDVSCST